MTKVASTKQKLIFFLIGIGTISIFSWLILLTPSHQDQEKHVGHDSPETSEWTCSMHPEIRLPKEGKCPKCAMDLIPLIKIDKEENPRILVMSEAAKKLARIQTDPVERKAVYADIHTLGMTEIDESRQKVISAWISGRIERLFVDYTGIHVNKGDHLFTIYSPDLLSAQEELIQTRKSLEEFKKSKNPEPFFRKNLEKTLANSRDKLRLLGLTDKQIEAIEQEGKLQKYLTIYAPIGGTVIQKTASEGSYVKASTPIYTIVDLSQLWVKLDIYPSNLSWIRYGQKVIMTTDAYPGQEFSGTIVFIDPMLHSDTQSIKVRVNLANPDGKLKPKLFIRTRIRVQLDAQGEAIGPTLANKWICLMHPEILKLTEGICDICEMKLINAESSPYGRQKNHSQNPLIIPDTAPLITGRRAIVYVELPNQERPKFEGREIILGPRAGKHYIVLEGLTEGERVVTHGNFKIDSALQIHAKPSMMSSVSTVNTKYIKMFELLFADYLKMQHGLSNSDIKTAKQHAAAMLKSINSIQKSRSDGITEAFLHHSSASTQAETLPVLRRQFRALSMLMIKLIEQGGSPRNNSYYKMYCPMAFGNTGASWIQDKKNIDNPYFGDAMRGCGLIKKEYTSP